MRRTSTLRAALAQINTTVGDLPGNRALVEAAYREAISSGAALVAFPELTLTGYPPEDLLLKPSFLEDSEASLQALAPIVTEGIVLVGYAAASPEGPRNAAALIAGGQVLDVYYKSSLPNYGVFDERRYFVPGNRCPVYEIGPWRIGVNICEDLWIPDSAPRVQAEAGGANLLINLSASPYHARKGTDRQEMIAGRARRFGVPILYTNLVGGQDELVFDGHSLAFDAGGRLLGRAAQFEPELLLIDLPTPTVAAPGGQDPRVDILAFPDVALTAPAGEAPGTIHPLLGEDEEEYRALILGLRDYVRKNAFGGVVIGLSGGIDSALTAVVAADALGPEAVIGISMPSGYTSGSARQGAAALARNLGIRFHEVPIGRLFDQTREELEAPLGRAEFDVTEENIQARLRGMLLMAFSNRLGHLVLATGNKSEIAVGYCTLYGDMVGGFSVLKDVLKTRVYRLARWRNAQSPQSPPIPEDTIVRPPSAELRPDQKDSDSLPPYETLDPILTALVQEEKSPRELVAAGYDRALVDRIFRMIQGNEYKRRQGAPGIKITPRAFGRDRRYPLTNRYRPREH